MNFATKSTRSVAITTLGLATIAPCFAFDGQWITVSQSGPIVAKTTDVQRFSETINIPKGLEKLQLNLSYTNGADGAPAYKWLRIASPSMSLVSEKQFQRNTYTEDVTGQLTWGGNQLLITGAGVEGSAFSWILRTPQPTLAALPAGSINSGSTVSITGTNLCPDASQYTVSIGGVSAHVVSASSTQLVVSVPENLKSGSQKINVSFAGINLTEAGNFAISIAAPPYLTSLSAHFVAPGETLTIYGEGFTSNPGQEVVYMGNFQAQIVQSNPKFIIITAPGALGDSWYGMFYPITVIVDGIKARNRLVVECHDV